MLSFFTPSMLLAEENLDSDTCREIIEISESKDIKDTLFEKFNSNDGNAIYNAGTTTVDNSEFNENYVLDETSPDSYLATKHYGGAIYNTADGKMTITSSDFTGNYLSSTRYVYGGAIYNAGSMSISGSTFSDNYTKATSTYSYSYGGAIYNTGTLTISDSYFYRNKTDGISSVGGGAIYNYATLTGTGTLVFEDNTTTLQGGAIFNSTSSSTIFKSVDFSKATSLSFSGNKATTGTGGAIYNGSTIYENADNFIMGDNVSFTENTAATLGGAIYNSGNMTIGDYATFTSNVSYGVNTGGATYYGGGAIYASGSPASTISTSTYTSGYIEIGDYATFTTNNSYEHGGAIYISTSAYSVEIGDDATFDRNTAADAGGAIYVDASITTTPELTMGDNASFTGNEANTGGAIYFNATNADGTELDYGSITIGTYANFSGNKATSGSGGALFLNGCDFEIGDYATFTSNSSGYHGGAIYLANGNLSFANATFTSNTTTATAAGGAIYFGLSNSYTNEGTLSIDESTFSNNSASGSGGAIASMCDLVVTNSTFEYNSATSGDEGGGALFLGTQSTTLIDNVEFTGNSADSDADSVVSGGGAISMRDLSKGAYATLDILNSAFTANTSATNGGAIYNNFSDSVNNDGYVTISNTTFDSNAAADSGGAIYNSEEYGTSGLFGQIWIEDSSFTNNSAGSEGGAIYVGENSIAYIKATTDITNIGNTAVNDASGGFLYAATGSSTTFDILDSATLTVGNSTAGQDSIAGEGSITKTGEGDLVVNSSMQDYTGSLSVDAGEMTINNILGASEVTVSSGAALTMGISDSTYSSAIFTNEDTSITGSGTLNLVATVSATAETYTVSASGSVDITNITTFGGSYKDNVFTLSSVDSTSVVLDVTGEVVAVDASSRIAISATGSDTTSVYLAFDSNGGAEITSVKTDTTVFASYIESYNAEVSTTEALLSLVSYEFNIDLDSTAESVLVSLYIGESAYDVSQFSIYHLGDETGDDWTSASVSNVSYDGKYLSFVVNDFCTYGVAVSASATIPEPSTYAMIIGVLALGFVAYRRRK